MKTPLILTCVIALVAGLIGWRGHVRSRDAQVIHRRLVHEIVSLGLSPDAAADGRKITDTRRAIRESRAQKLAEAKAFAKEFITFAKQMEEAEKDGGQADPETVKKAMEMMNRMMSLDEDQLKALVAELRSTSELEDETRKGMIMFAIMSLANDHPKEALAWFTESSDLIDDEMMRSHLVGQALAKWAQDDPLAAADWLKKNGEKFPDLVTKQTKQALVRGVAAKDPALAFQLVAGWQADKEKDDGQNYYSSIARSARTLDDATALLAVARKELSALDEKSRDQTMRSILASLNVLRVEGFEKSSKWLDTSGLSASEKLIVLQGMSYQLASNGADTGKWIEWVSASGALETESDHIVSTMASLWTQEDYQATGQWLASTPAGHAKDIAVQAYAQEIYPYEPEVAMQWVQTLPEGKLRQRTYEKIHNNLPKKTEEQKQAAKDFAEKYGLK